ncbi:hypothetical protein M5X17_27820 [Paenibacillus alvei]|uniref:hypothetical protein n=1 Tax=Paenibacillus alvei TaxID=44250 RepID=UPI0022812097|nr:hypothetical protein [Paenibacillus alvei]MCY9737515.1 hypothetical protein [Paenibacillus alvei]
MTEIENKVFYRSIKQYFAEAKFPFPEYAIYQILVENADSLQDIIEDCETNKHWFSFLNNDNIYNTSIAGDLHVLFDHEKLGQKYSYIINIYGYDEGSSCSCSSVDKNYNFEHKCCGENCEWLQPVINVKKLVNIGTYEFKGQEKDLWSLQKEWVGIELKTKEEIINEKVEAIDEEIRKLESKKLSIWREYNG